MELIQLARKRFQEYLDDLHNIELLICPRCSGNLEIIEHLTYQCVACKYIFNIQKFISEIDRLEYNTFRDL